VCDHESIYYVIIVSKNFCNTCVQETLTLDTPNLKGWERLEMDKMSFLDGMGISYVMPFTVTGKGTRRSVKGGYSLKDYKYSRGLVCKNRRFMSIASGYANFETKKIVDVLNLIEAHSKSNDLEKVNYCVKKLMNDPNFYIFCYAEIKGNPGMLAVGYNKDGSLADTLDGIDLSFFNKLAKTIGSGQFQFGALKQVNISKKDGGIRKLGIAASRDKIVQKALAVILEYTSEHKFYEGSFGFRKGKSVHSAIAFIKTKVPSGC